jgi:hypothetical protein
VQEEGACRVLPGAATSAHVPQAHVIVLDMKKIRLCERTDRTYSETCSDS